MCYARSECCYVSCEILRLKKCHASVNVMGERSMLCEVDVMYHVGYRFSHGDMLDQQHTCI